MGKVITDFTIKGRGRQAEEMDWDALFDGKVHQIEHGKDFKVKVTTLRQKATREAKERGGELEQRVDVEAGIVQLKYTAPKK